MAGRVCGAIISSIVGLGGVSRSQSSQRAQLSGQTVREAVTRIRPPAAMGLRNTDESFNENLPRNACHRPDHLHYHHRNHEPQ